MMTSHNENMKNKANPNAIAKLHSLLTLLALTASDDAASILNDELLLALVLAASLAVLAPKAT